MTDTDSLKAALKPCPLCGAYVTEETGYSDNFGTRPYQYASCSECSYQADIADHRRLADLRASTDAAPVAYRYVHLDYAGRKISRYGTHPERVNGHDPIEVQPLYAHPPVPDAAGEDALIDLIETAISEGQQDEGWTDHGLAKRVYQMLGYRAALAQPPAAEPVGMRELATAIDRARITDFEEDWMRVTKLTDAALASKPGGEGDDGE